MTTHDDSNGCPFGPGLPVSSITMQWGGSPTSPPAGSGTVAPGGKADSASIPFAEFAAQWMRQMTPGWSRLTAWRSTSNAGRCCARAHRWS